MKALLFAFLLPLTAISARATDDFTRGVDFIRTNMPERDKSVISEERIKNEVKQALEAREEFPWAKKTPWDIYANNVLPYATVTEERDEWRERFHKTFTPIVTNCKTATEATLAIAKNIQETIHVKYSTARRAPNQGIKESLESGLVSCTGQSILLIAALRSVGIPARMVGVLCWTHVRGNHSWVEAWCDGEWKMIEYNEKDFNTPWVMAAVGRLDPRCAANRVLATSWEKSPTGDFFPMVWEMKFNRLTGDYYFTDDAKCIHAVDVSKRYAKLAADWMAKQPGYVPGTTFMVDVSFRLERRIHRVPLPVTLTSAQGKVIAEGTTPGPEADLGKMLELRLPKDVQHATLSITMPDGSIQKIPVTHTDAPVQTLHLGLKADVPPNQQHPTAHTVNRVNQ